MGDNIETLQFSASDVNKFKDLSNSGVSGVIGIVNYGSIGLE